MKKKLKNNLILSFSILFFILIAVAGFFVVRTQQSGFGTSLLSLSQAELKSSNSYFNGKAWVYTFRQDGLGQHAYGTVTPKNVESKTNGEKPIEDFRIDVYYENQECVYPISVNYNEPEVYKFGVCEWTCIVLGSPSESYIEKKANEKCGISSSSIILYGKYDWSTTCYAVYKSEHYPVGYFGNTDIRSKMRIDIDAGEDSGSINLDTEGSIQGGISNFAYAIWQGNLDTGKSCKYTTDMPYKPVYVSGYWRTISKPLYEDYKSDYDDFIIRQEKTSGGSANEYLEWNNNVYYNKKDDLNSFINSFNSKSSSTLVSKNFGTIDSKSSMSKAVVRDEIQSPLQYPVITMYIKSDTLGIYTPTPEIEIIKGDSECFKTGENGNIALTVKNKGDEYGNWNVYGTCTNPFDATRRIDISLDAGQTKTIYLPLSATSIKRELGSCTITFESAGKKKTIKVDTCVDPHQTCVPNNMWCDSINNQDVIKKCDSGGVTSSVLKKCGTNEYCDASTYPPVCKESGSGGGDSSDCAWWDLKCHMKSWFKGIMGFFTPLIIVLSVFIAIISGMVTYKELTNRKVANDKTNRIAGLIFGMGFGFLFYYYIVVVLAIIAIYVLIKIILK